MSKLSSALLAPHERDFVPYLESVLARMRRLQQNKSIHLNGFRLEF